MRICDLVTPSDILVRQRESSKTQLIQKLSWRASAAVATPSSRIAELLLKREQLGSTGVGGGIAIPHARVEGLKKPYGALMCLESPIDFDSIDAQPVDLVFLLLLPANENSAHLSALAKIARLLRDKNVQTILRRAPTAEAAHSALCDAAKEFTSS